MRFLPVPLHKFNHDQLGKFLHCLCQKRNARRVIFQRPSILELHKSVVIVAVRRNGGEEPWEELIRADRHGQESSVIVPKLQNILLQRIHDASNSSVMDVIQRRIQPSPNVIRQPLDNHFVRKDRAKNRKPRASICKEKHWAASIISHERVLKSNNASARYRQEKVPLDVPQVGPNIEPLTNRPA